MSFYGMVPVNKRQLTVLLLEKPLLIILKLLQKTCKEVKVIFEVYGLVTLGMLYHTDIQNKLVVLDNAHGKEFSR
jgi:hypothetical protein